MVRGKGADHVFCRADSSRVRTQGDHSLSFNRLVDGLFIHQKLVPILFGFKPEGITGCPGPYKAIGFRRAATSRPVGEGFPCIEDTGGNVTTSSSARQLVQRNNYATFF